MKLRPRTLAGAIVMQLAGCSCSAFEAPRLPPPEKHCGAVPVGAHVIATAAHCPTYGEQLALDEGADLQLVEHDTKGAPPAKLRILPVEAGTDATLRGKAFVVVDPLQLSDGHYFLRAWPELEPGDSGFGLWAGGELLGVAIGNDGEHAVFAHAGEVARAIRGIGLKEKGPAGPAQLSDAAVSVDGTGPLHELGALDHGETVAQAIRINPMERSAP